MDLKSININALVEQTREQLEQDSSLTPALKVTIELLLTVVVLLSNKLGVNSNNSSLPPSQDINRKKKRHSSSERKAGGQIGRKGNTLTQTDTPDVVEVLELDITQLPKGNYREVGYQKRQVVDIDISRVVTEYRAQILENEQGERFMGEFPEGVTAPIQYGAGMKAHAVYLSQYQLLPYNRIEEYFTDQLGIPVSAGSLFAFNEQAASLITSTGAESIIKQQLRQSPLPVHVDETGINISGKRQWLHNTSSRWWTYFHPHAKRGKEAMDEADILPHIKGVLCHDHWKPYYQYTQCQHALCNAHHLRELERIWEQEGMEWAKQMQDLLKDINHYQQATAFVSEQRIAAYKQQYQAILNEAELACPPPDNNQRRPGQRGRLKRSKSRALLERLRDYEEDVLRFLTHPNVPFTNNQGENDIRMTKVHQKISGCFRSMQGAKIFCLVRSYLSSCRKQQITASEALTLLFQKKLPDIFIIEQAE